MFSSRIICDHTYYIYLDFLLIMLTGVTSDFVNIVKQICSFVCVLYIEMFQKYLDNFDCRTYVEVFQCT